MSLIFVNYRTGDGEATATLVERELSRSFGSENVFKASKSIGAGHRYPREIIRAVRRSSVLLAVIGRDWMDARDADGQVALEKPDDWTRREILEAFETGVLVIPLLVDGAERLSPEKLPEALGELADCQYRRLNHRNAETDLARLTDDLISLVPDLATAAQATGYAQPQRELDGRETPSTEQAGEARVRAHVIKHRQRGGIGSLNGDFSGTFVSEPQGPVHTGSGHLYQAHEQQLAPRFSGDGMGVNYVAGDNSGTMRQQSSEVERRADKDR
ncbi:TIR domain-containing protein [Streptomyces youssoufiensis]